MMTVRTNVGLVPAVLGHSIDVLVVIVNVGIARSAVLVVDWHTSTIIRCYWEWGRFPTPSSRHALGDQRGDSIRPSRISLIRFGQKPAKPRIPPLSFVLHHSSPSHTPRGKRAECVMQADVDPCDREPSLQQEWLLEGGRLDAYGPLIDRSTTPKARVKQG
jgi:hypothetical protein